MSYQFYRLKTTTKNYTGFKMHNFTKILYINVIDQIRFHRIFPIWIWIRPKFNTLWYGSRRQYVIILGKNYFCLLRMQFFSWRQKVRNTNNKIPSWYWLKVWASELNHLGPHSYSPRNVLENQMYNIFSHIFLYYYELHHCSFKTYFIYSPSAGLFHNTTSR